MKLWLCFTLVFRDERRALDRFAALTEAMRDAALQAGAVEVLADPNVAHVLNRLSNEIDVRHAIDLLQAIHEATCTTPKPRPRPTKRSTSRSRSRSR